MSHRKVFFTVIAAVCGLSLGAAADVVPAAAIEGGVNDGLPRPLPSLVQISGVSDDRPNPLPSLVSCVNDGRLCALPSMASLFEIDHLSLLLCHIPKCGSTGIGLWMLQTLNTTSYIRHSIHKTVGAQVPIALSARYDNSSWTRVAVLRDPVDRFASAYLDKCMRAENGNCPDVEHRLDVRAVLTRLEEQYAQDVTSVNRHFLAQANFCQLRDMHSSFSIVPFPRIEEGWASMVRRLSLASENLRPPLLQWTKKFISSGAHANHRTNASILAAHWRRAAAAKEPHADSDILPRLMALYEDDYSLISSVNSWAVPPPRNSQGNVSLATTDAPALRSQKIARWPMRGHSRGPGTVPTPPALNRPSGWGSATKRKRGSSLH